MIKARPAAIVLTPAAYKPVAPCCLFITGIHGPEHRGQPVEPGGFLPGMLFYVLDDTAHAHSWINYFLPMPSTGF
jgi:hypothetical protein